MVAMIKDDLRRVSEEIAVIKPNVEEIMVNNKVCIPSYVSAVSELNESLEEKN
jgi:predicted HAD superfamily phosphohydrolase